MKNADNEIARTLLATQLKRYRKAFGLSQRDVGEVTGLDGTYVGLMERGLVSVGLDNIVKVADLFGVAFYDFLNPETALPEKTALHPDAQRHLREKRSSQEKRATDRNKQKNEGGKVYATGTAKRLHGLVAEGFFKRPRTAKEAYLLLNELSPAAALTPQQQRGVSNITGTLSQGKFLHLLDKLDPEPGSTAVRFVSKATASVPYPETLGHTGMAADKP